MPGRLDYNSDYWKVFYHGTSRDAIVTCVPTYVHLAHISWTAAYVKARVEAGMRPSLAAMYPAPRDSADKSGGKIGDHASMVAKEFAAAGFRRVTVMSSCRGVVLAWVLIDELRRQGIKVPGLIAMFPTYPSQRGSEELAELIRDPVTPVEQSPILLQSIRSIQARWFADEISVADVRLEALRIMDTHMGELSSVVTQALTKPEYSFMTSTGVDKLVELYIRGVSYICESLDIEFSPLSVPGIIVVPGTDELSRVSEMWGNLLPNLHVLSMPYDNNLNMLHSEPIFNRALRITGLDAASAPAMDQAQLGEGPAPAVRSA